MDVAGVTAAYSARGTVIYTHAPRADYAAITPTTSMSMDTHSCNFSQVLYKAP